MTAALAEGQSICLVNRRSQVHSLQVACVFDILALSYVDMYVNYEGLRFSKHFLLLSKRLKQH